MAYFITSDLTKIYYEDKGQGQPFVLQHGGYVNSNMWKPTVEWLLERGYRVVTFDGRGHGGSGQPETGYTMERWATDLAELIDYLGLDDVILLGYSWSCHVALMYFRLFGCDRIAKFINMDMSALWVPDETWEGAGILKGTYTYKDAMKFLSDMERDTYGAMYFFAEQCSCADNVPDGYVEAGASGLVHYPINFMKCLWTELVNGDYREDLKKLTIPVLYVYGEPGSLYSRKDVDYMMALTPDSQCYAVKGGHEYYFQPGGPEQLHAALESFL